jgi:uncharacterized protein with GYD domain
LTVGVGSGTLDPMPQVYLDTNVYSCIHAENIETLRAAMSLCGIVPRLQVARDLVGFDDILKQPCDLLGDAIRAYAAGELTPSQILPPDQQELVEECLHRAARGRTAFKVQTLLWTQGPYDLVSIIDAPSEEAMMGAMANVVAAGNVSSTTMRAFDDKEMEGISKKV